MAFPTTRGSDETFTFAIAWTRSGMPPLEYAFATFRSIGIERRLIRSTRSRSGIRTERPPRTTR